MLDPNPRASKRMMKRKKQQSTTYGKTSLLKKNILIDYMYFTLKVNHIQYFVNIFLMIEFSKVTTQLKKYIQCTCKLYIKVYTQKKADTEKADSKSYKKTLLKLLRLLRFLYRLNFFCSSLIFPFEVGHSRS